MAQPIQPNIFGDNYRLSLTSAELTDFRRPLSAGAWGGNQIVVNELQQREVYGKLLMTDDELCDAYTKAWAYGDGTWQKYFRVIEMAARREGWRPPERLVDEVWARRNRLLQ